MKAAKPALTAGEPADLNVAARFLYGAAGADLELSGEVTLRLAQKSSIPGLEEYQIGLTDEAYEPTKSDIEDPGKTNAQGQARISVSVPEAETTRPVEAEIAVRAAEPGGRAITRTVTLPVNPKGVVIGVKPLFKKRRDRRRPDGALSCGRRAGRRPPRGAQRREVDPLEGQAELPVVLPGRTLGLRGGQDDAPGGRRDHRPRDGRSVGDRREGRVGNLPAGRLDGRRGDLDHLPRRL